MCWNPWMVYEVHPRACGETAELFVYNIEHPGPSPRVRGNLCVILTQLDPYVKIAHCLTRNLTLPKACLT